MKRSKTVLQKTDPGEDVVMPIPLFDDGKGVPQNVIGLY